MSRTLTQEEFITKAKQIHGNNYNYDLTNYVKNHSKLVIVCRNHGNFSQKPAAHLDGKGCQLCGNMDRAKASRDNPNGWTKTRWVKGGEVSKYFDSFKVYIIKCWNSEEEFYKIGRTYTTCYKRFHSGNNHHMPYNYEVLKIIEDKDGGFIYDLENRLKEEHKEHKYLPKIKFSGMHECFSKINLQKLI